MTVTYRMAQMNPVTGDIEGNTDEIIATLEAEDDADVVVFPEMAVTGYTVGDMVEDDAFIEDNMDALDEIAAYTEDTAVVVGFVDDGRYADDDGLYNAAAVLYEGEVKDTVEKSLLPSYRYFDDDRYFDAGDDTTPVDLEIDGEEVSLGVSICEDMWDEAYDRSPVDELAEQGAEVIVNINASPYEVGKREDRLKTIRGHVEEHEVPFLYANTVGAADVGGNVLVFDGQSLAVDADGEVIAAGQQFGEDTVEAVFEDAEALDLPDRSREAELFDALAYGLQDYMDKTGFDEIIEPISGGIDSSLGLAVAVEAVGADNVVAYSMPSEVNSATTKDAAEELAGNLGVEYREMPVQGIYEETLETYEDANGQIEDSVSRENVYARTRGMLAMLASNETGGMLVSNGNETELALGYATLYGDMTGGLAILGDLPKPEVYDVARHVNERYDAPIPEEVFEVPPSAELSEDQEDPFDYDVVAPIVQSFLEDRLSPGDLLERFEDEDLPEAFEEGVLEEYDRERFAETVQDTFERFQGSSFKRVQAPPVIAVSDRAFGRDFREPIINGWEGDLDG
jgi:NAD+ synthase (glutamine-hydrolysing)